MKASLTGKPRRFITITATLTLLSGVLGGAVTAVAADGTPKSADELIASEESALRETGLFETLAPGGIEKPAQFMKVLSESEFAESPAPIAMVRYENQKLSFMDKDEKGNPKPFLPLMVETGFWDSRACNHAYQHRRDKLFSCVTAPQSPFTNIDGSKSRDIAEGMRNVFRKAKELGFNTIQITYNWAEWDKTEQAGNPKFDFSEMDQLTNDAAAAGLKVQWVLFFHVQRNMPNWNESPLYKLATKEGVNYSIQWGQGQTLRDPADYTRSPNDAVPELYPEYWQPTMSKHLNEALGAMATHFKDNPHVIGYQVGNEEGPVGPQNNRVDSNPYREALYKLWLKDREQTDTPDNQKRFLKELGIAVWRQFAGTMRAIDPYKMITTNFQGGDVDKGWGTTAGGQDINFYKDAGMDVLAPMYYSNDNSIRNTYDRAYGAKRNGDSGIATKLPGLLPSEIGVSWNRGSQSLVDAADVLARGGQGYGMYSIGELLVQGPKMVPTVTRLNKMVANLGDSLPQGLPVSAATTTNLYATLNNAPTGDEGDDGMSVSNLEHPNGTALVIYNDSVTGSHFAGNDFDLAAGRHQRQVTVTAKQAGTYTVTGMVDGEPLQPSEHRVQAGETFTFPVTVGTYGAAFLDVKKQAEPAPAPKPEPAPEPTPVPEPSPVTPAKPTVRFIDIATDPFRADIETLAERGIVRGWSDRTFRPYNHTERQALMAFFYRLAGSPQTHVPAQGCFKDVKSTHTFAKEICWAKQEGITTGWADNTFRGNEPVSRAAFAAFLHRYAKLAGKPTAVANPSDSFKDVSAFANDIAWLKQEKIAHGWSDGTFRPLLPIERNALAAMINRFMQKG